MSRHEKGKKVKNKHPELHLPTLESFSKATAADQIMMWRRAKAWLDPEKRAEANRNRTPKPNYEMTVLFIRLYEARWKELKQEAIKNPDFFDWPETQVWLGDGNLDPRGWMKDGVLSIFGYSVGQEDALSADQRKAALDYIFSVNIPPIFGWDQLRQWSEPETPQRLLKMANCLASFSRNAKHRRDNQMKFAVQKWESDLGYLKSKFYDGIFQFGFPTC